MNPALNLKKGKSNFSNKEKKINLQNNNTGENIEISDEEESNESKNIYEDYIDDEDNLEDDIDDSIE